MKKAFLFLTILAFHLSLSAQSESGDIAAKGDKMPEFQLSSAKHGEINSKDLKGKLVLINIFATWCPPCQLELAEVKKTLWPKFKDEDKFVMLTVGREHTDDELTKYNEKKQFSFPLYPDPERGFTSKFAKTTIPRTYLVDQNDIIIYASKGYKKEEFQELMLLIEEELAK
ncbi:TlpA disulfide reductase family protein [Dysgonomonas sp. Marseille-P4361]|uniref:TlpA family protein disulfide reductase n=1 Tax=Dysgonomonas sp. Marseille-P4361 TaxID=2161820 RepID=UPI000D54B289|nr:TlpA disulfide reductase family protein [Dysgonomonas sp. Marseille-P4361]